MSLQFAIDKLGTALCEICTLDTENLEIDKASGLHYPPLGDVSPDAVSPWSYLFLNKLDILIGKEIRNVIDIVEALAKERGTSELNNNLSIFNPNLIPKAPPTAVSINHLRIIYTSVELLWVSGVQSFLVSVLEDNFDWGEAPHPKSLLISRDKLVSFAKAAPSLQQMFSYSLCINKLISNFIFSSNMLPRNLHRMLVAFLALANCDSKALGFSRVDDRTIAGASKTSFSIRERAKQLLTEVCFSTENKSLVISELRIASKGPKWLRVAASELFSKVILSENGLDAALRAYLEGVSSDQQVDSLPVLIQVAKLMTSVPAGLTKSVYLSQMSPQIVEVLEFALQTNNFVMQKVCVLIVTRVSHLSSDICCDNLLRPLSMPLLKTDKEHLSRTKGTEQSGCAQMKGTDDNVRIESAVCALHALVTLCPLQTPLMVTIQRSGVGTAAIALLLFLLSEDACRALPLVSMLTEISFALLKTTSDPGDFANQLLEVVVHPKSNKYSVSAEGILSIRHSTSMRARRNNNTSADQLVSQLGISAPNNVGISNSGIVSSPSDLLAAMRHQDKLQSDSASASSSDNACVGSQRKKEKGSRPGQEVEDILSMAAAAALELERTAADKLPRSERDILQGIRSSLDQTLDSGDEMDEDEEENQEGEEDDVGDGLGCKSTSAHTMLSVSVRAKAVAEVLLLFEQHMGRGIEGGADSRHVSGHSAQGIEDSMRQHSGVEDETEEDEVESVAAEFFLRCLETFLGDQSHTYAPDKSASPQGLIADSLLIPTKSSSVISSVQSSEVFDKGLCGLVMVVMQAHIPIESLLGGGHKIIRLIHAVLQSKASHLEAQSSSSQQISTVSHDLPAPSSSQNKKVLIEELDPKSMKCFEENKNDVNLDFQVDPGSDGSPSYRMKRRISEIADGVIGDDEQGGGGGEEEEEGEDSDDEVLTCALGILNGILSLGKSTRSVKVEESLRTLLWPLQIISYRESNKETAKLAADAALLILTRSRTNKLNTDISSKIDGVGEVMKGVVNEKDNVHSPFASLLFRALQDYCDSPEPHMRALGVHMISTAIGDVSQPLSDSDIDIATETMINMLQDNDSYVYMSVLTSISRLADLPSRRGRMFSSLLDVFSECPQSKKSDVSTDVRRVEINESASANRGKASAEAEHGMEGSAVHYSPRLRALVGEALASVLRRAGDAAPPLVPSLVAACITVVRARASDEAVGLVEDHVNLRTMIVKRPAQTDSSAEQTNQSDEHTQAASAVDLTVAAAAAADIALLRQSAMSLLAESVVCAGWTASKYLLDILDIAVGVLTLEGMNRRTQTSSSIHRSAAFLLRNILSGLREKLTVMNDGGTYLKCAYRALKVSVRSEDEVVRHHCEAALGALDEMMRDELFISGVRRRDTVPQIRILR